MAPSPWSWQAAWVELAAVAVLAVAYVLAARRRPPSRARAACFAAALVALVALAVTPIATLALHYLLAAHLVQNVALAEWIPLLAVAGIPPAIAAEIGRFRVVRLLTAPFVALPLWLAGYAAWHVPQPYDAALENHLLLHLEHLTYFVTGVLLWWCVVHARPWGLTWGEKSAYVFAAFVFASPLGLLLALLPSPLYDFYVAAPELWGLTPLADQQIAGIAMAVSESILFFAVFAYCFVRFMAEEDAAVDSLG
ncbi:MAG TPA: cytochrome c oxidase assembly protein [Gaiellaceae bacterium]|nr:cytochrome c oxidase assembly protein [Gaiellaceae bacterium]